MTDALSPGTEEIKQKVGIWLWQEGRVKAGGDLGEPLGEVEGRACDSGFAHPSNIL